MPVPPLSTLTSRAAHARPTSPRSTGFCAIWDCISSSSSSKSNVRKRCLDACTFIERSRAVSYVGRYDDNSPKEALSMPRSRARCVWGHAAIFVWSDLFLDRSRKFVGLHLPLPAYYGRVK